MGFKDHFSKQSADYAIYRPDYPVDLFVDIVALVPDRNIAWDAGCGTGKASYKLGDYFNLVVATDPSYEQVSHAIKHENVRYVTGEAERACLKSGSVDLVTVAQALHWFDFTLFYKEVKRVLKPEGVLAVWVYGLAKISPEIDSIVSHFYYDVIGQYWPPERRYIDTEYRTLPFDFERTELREYTMELYWTADAFLGYLGTWSSVQRFIDKNGYKPLEGLARELKAAWGKPGKKRYIQWPIHAKIGWMGE